MIESEKENKIYPLMPLRDIVVFPHMVAPLVVGRQKSIKALENAMSKKTEIFLVTQWDANEDEPQPEALHSVGTIAVVMQLLRLPDGTIKALVEGKKRGRIISFQPQLHFMAAEIEETPETDDAGPEIIAYMREIRAAFEEYIKTNKKVPKEVLKSLGAITDPARFVDVSVSHLPLQTNEKQEILEVFSVLERLQITLEFIQREIEIAKLEYNIRSRVKKKMEKTQKDYYLNEQIR
ncbi:MAG: LON peptidase substrate-binding domain-containing protein, partial [Desulfobulbales bacterium]